MAFKEYLIWYLDNLATSHIFNSKTDAKNLSLYLRYKNMVMSYYVHFPEFWYGNHVPDCFRHWSIIEPYKKLEQGKRVNENMIYAYLINQILIIWKCIS